MKLSSLICALVLCSVLALAADPPANNVPPVLLWSTSFEGFAIAGGEPAAVKNVFAPERAITVTRIEAYDEQGPRLNVHSVTGQIQPCSPQPSLMLTDGTSSQTVTISSVFAPNSSATYTDSGPLSLSFLPGNRISLLIVPPKSRQPYACMARQMNVIVHYTMSQH